VKSDYYLRHVRLYICLPACMKQLDEFWWNLIFEFFTKICRENSSCIKIWQEQVLDMKTFGHFWRYLAEFLLEWETLQRKSKHTFHGQNRAAYEIMSKNMVQPETALSLYGCALHAGLVRLHARKHTPAPVYPHARTHRVVCSTYCFSTATVVSWTHLDVTSYAHCLSYYFNDARVVEVIKH
jgi:hypothetical protein